MERQRIHDRRRPAARTVGRAKVGKKRGRRVRRTDRVRVIAAARGDGAAENDDLRRDCLQRVVGAGEQRFVCRCSGIGSVRIELRQPVTVDVGLVADHEIPHLRQNPRQRRRIRRELLLRLLGQWRGPVAEVHDRHQDLHPVQPRGLHDVAQNRLVGRARRRLARRPDLRHPNSVEPRSHQQIHLRLRLGQRRLTHAVLRSPDQHRRTPCTCGRCGNNTPQQRTGDDETLHNPWLRIVRAPLAESKEIAAWRPQSRFLCERRVMALWRPLHRYSGASRGFDESVKPRCLVRRSLSAPEGLGFESQEAAVSR